MSIRFDPPSPSSCPRLQRKREFAAKKICLFVLFAVFLFDEVCAQSQHHDPTTLNGGSILAMAGRECVAVALDKRFGSGPTLVTVSEGRSIFLPSKHVLVGFTGLQSDVETLQDELLTLVASKYSTGITVQIPFSSSRNHRLHIPPRSMASLISHVLYARRQAPYYVEPVVIGLVPSTKKLIAAASIPSVDASSTHGDEVKFRPYLCSMDVIGATSLSSDFVCGGAATSSLYGTAEAFYKPNLPPEDLVQIIAKTFSTALERDCLSGYGILVYLLTVDGITEYTIDTRND